MADVASRADAPMVVLHKVRKGDRDVEVSVPDVERWRDHTPVLVDDIVSTGRTMAETIGHLRRAGLAAPVCIAIHAVFSGNAVQDLESTGAGLVVSCDTVVHPTNGISVAPDLASAVRELMQDPGGAT
ncbi:phosphoribosyltransferase family protein, partial [Leclercia adecarboxylata]|nr:phosphoribosyltransferase family protein [Leclercia adecarboxylata]